ncbi:MAG: hypothetical protein P8P56_03360 [Yoonia sp.]|nr:hypothetical protein [Yoonia sp.]
MIAAANILTDLYLSLAALAGLVILQVSLKAGVPDDPLVRRLVFGLRVGMMLFAGRALIVVTGGQGFRFLVLLAAALVPLAALLITEGLLRRHAPPFAKVLIGGGAAVFGLSAFWVGASIDPPRLIGLLAFQVFGFCLSGWLIYTRDAASLSMAENRMAVRLGLTILLLMPLAATDFLLVVLQLPVQISAIGVLVLCWIALGLSRTHEGHRRSYAALAVMLGASFATGAFLSMLAGLQVSGAVLVIAVIMAMVLVLACAAVARDGRARGQTESLMAHMAQATGTDPLAFLRGLQSHPLVSGAVIVDQAALAGLDPRVLDRIFAAAPVLQQSARPALGPAAEDHMDHLVTRYGATHILDTGLVPRCLVALAMPALHTSARAQVELRAVQRMAALMAQAEQGK